MSWQQLKPFNLSKMGKQKDWCLANVAKGFGVYGVPSALPSAKADMEFNRNKGTLHKDNPPANLAVPVYVDTISQYEHVEVCDKGTYYSDGVKVNKPSNTFGWGEYCNGVRIVKWVEDTKKSNEQIAKEVIAGVWGNGAERKKRLTNAGYDYNAIQQIVNQLLTPKKKTNEQIAKEVIKGLWGNGLERKKRLEKAGYNYNTIQSIVNRLLSK